MLDFAKSIMVGNRIVGRPAEMGEQLGYEDADYGRYKNREQLKKYFEVTDEKTLSEIERGYKKGQEKYEDRYSFNRKSGNSKVGNADLLSGNYIILDDEGGVWFRDEHENVNIRNIDSWAQKRIAEYQRSIDEIKKGVQEAKQAAKKAGLI